MKPNIIPVEFPNGGAIEAAAQNEEGTYTIYANTRFPQQEQESAVKEIIEGRGAMNNHGVFKALAAFPKEALR